MNARTVRFLVIALALALVAVVVAARTCPQDEQVPQAQSAALTRRPYLQDGTPTSVVVRWRTSIATNTRVRYGTVPGALSFEADQASSLTEHAIALTNLIPATRYYYAVGSSDGLLEGDDEDHAFVTAPAPGTSSPVRIWVLGDSGTANNDARRVRDSYYAFPRARQTSLWLMLGDNAYESGKDSEYQKAVFDMYPTMLSRSVLWPTIGNHDTAQLQSVPATLPYFEIFSLPTAGEAGGLASGTERYYSFDYGNIHFICLDSMTSDRSRGGAMMTWLASDLASTGEQWIIAYWHHPPYSKGSHDSDSDPQLAEMRQNALPILENGGVDLVLSGHSHSYERSFLIDGHYGKSSTFNNAMKKDGGSGQSQSGAAYHKPSAVPEPHEGAVYAVAGSSGQVSGGSLNHPAMFISLNTLGSMVIDLEGSRLEARFLRDDGSIGDQFTIVKGPIPPTAPDGLKATAISSARIELRWSDHSSDEDGFRIEQSADGRTFVQAGSVAANITSFQIDGLSPGTAYTFRVDAFNAEGQSEYSNVSGATTEHARRRVHP
ncbi:MAG: fibronectin type III domain-containing protein [Acidobacteriota bacterium]